MRIAPTSISLGLAVIIIVCSVAANENPTAAQTDNETATQTQDAEAEFLEGLHYSHEDFMRIYESLPRDEDNKVDWERATKEGLIEPLAAAGENSG